MPTQATIAITPGSGQFLDAVSLVIGATTVVRETVVLADPTNPTYLATVTSAGALNVTDSILDGCITANVLAVSLPSAQITTLTPPSAAAIGSAVAADLLIGTQVAGSSLPVALPSATITALTPPSAAAIAAAIVANPPTISVSGNVGVTQTTTPWVISGTVTAVTSITNPIKIEGHAGGIFDAVSGTAVPANVLQVGGSDGTDLRPILVDALGNVGVNYSAIEQASAMSAAWTNATALNTTLVVSGPGYGNCAFGLSSTVAAFDTGIITFECSIDGSTWVALDVQPVNQFGTFTTTAPAQPSNTWQMFIGGFYQVRIRLSTAITNSGTATVWLRPSVSGTEFAQTVFQPTGSNLHVQVDTAPEILGEYNSVLPNYAPGGTKIQTDSHGQLLVTAGATAPGTAAALTVQNIKSSPGTVIGVSVNNPNAGSIYLQFYNTAGTPTLGTSVVWWLSIPPGAFNIPPGLAPLAAFTTGIGIGAATTATGGSAPVSAPDVVIFYK